MAGPTYAPAHAGLALAHCAQAGLRLVPPPSIRRREGGGSARASNGRFVRGRTCCARRGFVLQRVELVRCKKSLERALELNPWHTEARLLYGKSCRR